MTGSGIDTIKFRAGNIFETFPATREGIFLYTAEIHPYQDQESISIHQIQLMADLLLLFKLQVQII